MLIGPMSGSLTSSANRKHLMGIAASKSGVFLADLIPILSKPMGTREEPWISVASSFTDLALLDMVWSLVQGNVELSDEIKVDGWHLLTSTSQRQCLIDLHLRILQSGLIAGEASLGRNARVGWRKKGRNVRSESDDGFVRGVVRGDLILAFLSSRLRFLEPRPMG